MAMMFDRILEANEVIARARPTKDSWRVLGTRVWRCGAYFWYYYFARLGDGLLDAARGKV
jgi:hypothetical protein